MKLIIIGKTATGKHFLAKKLLEQGLNVAKSYTTNPDTQIGVGYPEIISATDAANVPIENKFMLFSENNTETYILHSDLEKADVLILHPNDMSNIASAIPNESIHVIHITCKDAQAQADIETKNGPRPGKSLKERQIDESIYYDKWEKDLAVKSTFGMNQIIIHQIENDYDENTIDNFVLRFMMTLECRKNLIDIIKDCIELGIITVDENKNIPMEYNEPSARKVNVPIDIFTDIIMLESPVQLSNLITLWLSLSHDVTAGNREFRKTQAEQEKLETSKETITENNEIQIETTENSNNAITNKPADVIYNNNIISE